MKSQAADCCHVVAFPVGSVLIVPGEPEIGHQHPVLEDRRSPDGLQSAEACFSEKYSNRRWGSIFLPFCGTPSFSRLFHGFVSPQASPTHRSAFPANPGHSAASQARPHAAPALATPTLVTAPAPAPPATPPLSMQVRATEVHRVHEKMELKCHRL